MSTVTCCDECLRRGALVGMIARPLADLLDPRRRTPNVLALNDEDLMEAVGGRQAGPLAAAYRSFDPAGARTLLDRTDCEAVCRHSDQYPQALRTLDDPPNPLYLRGGTERFAELVGERRVAIVGGR